MAKNHLNINKQFMIGNGALAFAVIIVVVIFVYMSYRLMRDPSRKKYYVETYNIELVTGFSGNSISIYINDSLLLNQVIDQDSFKLKVGRFEDQNALLIIDNHTEKVSTFNLSEKGGSIFLRKEEEMILQEGEVIILRNCFDFTCFFI